MLAHYYPDFMLRTAQAVYLVETKATAYLNDENVQRKQKGALDWLRTLNELPPELRGDRDWKYALVGENAFYTLHKGGANIVEIMEQSLLTQEIGSGRLL
jgi:type III restriction enzyme